MFYRQFSHPANDDQNNHCKTDKTEEKSNKQFQENNLSVNTKDELNEQIINDEDSEEICISILTFIMALLFILSFMSVNLISLNINHFWQLVMQGNSSNCFESSVFIDHYFNACVA